jgi:hypothetical protein
MGGILLPLIGQGASNNINPSQLPSLNLWYDASVSNASYIQTTGGVAPTDNQPVNSWIDKQATGRNANQTTGTRQPTWQANEQNGLGVILFDGVTDVLTLNPIGNWALSLPGQTTYIVLKANALTGIPRATMTNTGGYQFFWDSFWGIETAGGRAKSTFAGDTTNYHYMAMILDGTQTDPDITVQNNKRLKMRIDGVPQSLTFSTNVNTTTSASATGLFVGGDSQPVANPFSGYIAEMMIWTRTLTLTEQLQVETYLSTKWAI